MNDNGSHYRQQVERVTRPTGTRRGAWLLAVLAVVAPSASCGGPPDGTADSLTVVVTTTPLGDLVRNVVGEAATVEVLMPVGADAHEFQLSAEQVARLATADLVVVNGLGLEARMEDALETIDGAKVLALAPLLDPQPFDLDASSEPCDPTASQDDHEGDACDPHVWTDPLRMVDAARIVGRRLDQLDPSADFSARADEYAAELMRADSEITEILSVVPAGSRKIVTNHEALSYFARRYELDVIGVVIPGGSTLAAPSSAELAALVDVIEEAGARAIFAETVEQSALAEAVASEVGDDVSVVELYTESLGEPGSGADSLIGMLVTNARRIAEALE
ncbi:MAG TPA: metal ABC transporter substrate-binding protein [Acidimicrobiia bacterium]